MITFKELNKRIPRKKGQPANSKKHSDLYTDENPKGTIHGLGFKDVATAKKSVAKIKSSGKSHAHKFRQRLPWNKEQKLWVRLLKRQYIEVLLTQ